MLSDAKYLSVSCCQLVMHHALNDLPGVPVSIKRPNDAATLLQLNRETVSFS